MADVLIAAQFVITAIDFAHRQSRHLVLTDRAYFTANSAQPMLKDIKSDYWQDICRSRRG